MVALSTAARSRSRLCNTARVMAVLLLPLVMVMVMVMVMIVGSLLLISPADLPPLRLTW